MSRAALFNALIADATLNGYGINSNTVFHNWSKEERPTNGTAFAILRWEDEAKPLWGSEPERGPRNLTAWVHYPIELSNDFNKVTRVLDRMDDVLRGLRDVAGNDGYKLSFVQLGGRSPDLVDDGFNTITRHASYQIYSVPSI
ncbi:tail terminator [Mycobacterium phage Rope]|uniref:Tail terminator n=8 Tax=Papyrusvirus TaxID=1982554 RepID=A0A120HUJ4_9CAUD|nr:hypothetical protein N842_gp021 [Mycobacterium phage Papyrus]YP_009614246.1 hypothetical protein FDI62_gp21 [Mycobacterium phage Send513]AMB17235.1 hypothetical protein SEA_WEISS13_21 [Mycobacterium phage Weiss13]ARW57107.1 hypothetical protein SEA_ZENON_22 [Mycobacterium phage Zenon]AVO21420.1 tail terminator [Mycobacterium phage Nilo]AYQ98595.1 tail terminator [Mycobacterium phage Riparian]QCG78128.1 hypothetical protein SEA_CANDLE_21 [Mycobacterium phage Candle]QNN99681.1 tail terminat